MADGTPNGKEAKPTHRIISLRLNAYNNVEKMPITLESEIPRARLQGERSGERRAAQEAPEAGSSGGEVDGAEEGGAGGTGL